MVRKVGLGLLVVFLAACSVPAAPRVVALKAAHKVVRFVTPALAIAPGCGSHLHRVDEGQRGLRLSHGIALLGLVPAPALVRADAGHNGSLWYGGPLPAPEPPNGRHVVIFYSPHPDDESLSAGVFIAQAAARGDRVIVVALTDGSDTRARIAINARLALAWRATHTSEVGFNALTPAAIGAARLGELRRAAGALGVSPADVYAAHLDDPRSDCGSTVSVHEADQVERAFAARFPWALHVTMSYEAERQQDHLAAGIALRRLLAAHVVDHAEWVVSRLWWTLPSPSWKWVTPTQPSVAQQVFEAARQYELWDPAQGRYAIGLYSVHDQFEALQRDERDRLHGTGPDVAGYVPSRDHVRFLRWPVQRA